MAPDQPLPGRVGRTSRTGHRGAHEAAEHVIERVREVKEEVKPKLRGWLHAATIPLALAAGIVLIVLSPTLSHAGRVGGLRRTGAAALHRLRRLPPRHDWSPRTRAFLRRIDHSNIFLLIAGLLHAVRADPARTAAPGWSCSPIVWTGADRWACVSRIFWIDAPRWIYVPIYIALGWVAIFYAGDFASGGPP